MKHASAQLVFTVAFSSLQWSLFHMTFKKTTTFVLSEDQHVKFIRLEPLSGPKILLLIKRKVHNKRAVFKMKYFWITNVLI